MDKIIIALITLFISITFVSAQEKKKDTLDFPILKGAYLGQKPPGKTPEIFAAEIISFGQHEHGFVISPANDEAFYVKPSNNMSIMHLKRENDRWLAPEIAPFSGQFKDMCLRFSLDGKKIYFTSKRPIKGKTDFNIWIVEKKGETWKQPVSIGNSVNTNYNECNPSVAANGNLYFQYFTNNGLKSDIYYSPYKNGSSDKPEKLPPGINTEYNDAGPFIAPDESYLMFHSNRPGGYGYMDLYISFKNPDGSWGKAKNLGEAINTGLSESGAYVTPDNKYLFFSNYFGQRIGHIYWVDASLIDSLRK